MPSTSERAEDPRPARTRAAIFAAARALTVSDGEVTVNALAKRAGVSRAAFYSHFSGLDDLMGAMLTQMFDHAHERSTACARDGRTVQERVRFGFGMLVAYVERHHTFLRGALDWKFSRRTYLVLVDTMTELHAEATDRLGDAVPEHLRTEDARRAIVGGSLALCEHWLVTTEQAAADGGVPDATGLLDSILAIAPSWYTGLEPGAPTGAAELLEICRQVTADEES
ncbi:TetR family transcriptional regulator [Brachybacterium vulturis]|uniref:TetR family transcriptional regulator n=1 Tax=Brachybacterium vulturis TaxID=2017484 RepID=A0A291GJT6_9MICO|nr:TetR/AcrR family transcriptional regulator [Brachybacterium vulturis]ATG50244.1 TetR family transcriptional regulator [Brachybacterium vulturis]